MSHTLLASLVAPWRQKIANERGIIHPLWQRFFQDLVNTVGAVPLVALSVSLATQAAAILATVLVGNALSDTRYRISYYVRVSRAATVSSSVTVTLRWTDGGVAQSLVGTALVGNTTTTLESKTELIHLDVNTTVTYEVAYASVGATTMQYTLEVAVEPVPGIVGSGG